MSARVSGTILFLFKIMTRMKLWFSNCLEHYSYSFQGSRINLHYSYSFLVALAECSYRIEAPPRFLKNYMQLQLHASLVLEFKNAMISKRMVIKLMLKWQRLWMTQTVDKMHQDTVRSLSGHNEDIIRTQWGCLWAFAGRIGCWLNGFVCGFLSFCAAGLFLVFFLFVGKIRPENSPGKSPANPPNFMQEIPTHFCRGARPKNTHPNPWKGVFSGFKGFVFCIGNWDYILSQRQSHNLTRAPRPEYLMYLMHLIWLPDLCSKLPGYIVDPYHPNLGVQIHPPKYLGRRVQSPP